MIVAAHQPAYLPWLGYLHKIAGCDVFVLVDDVQYEAQNFQNRNRVKVNNGVAWLTVPLVHGPREERVSDKLIQNQASPKEHWQRRTWQTLLTHYRRSPHFARYADDLEEVYARPWERLLDLDVHLLQLCLRWLGISRPIVRASSLDTRGDRTDRIASFCQRLGADVYLSGRGGSTQYLDIKTMDAAGVRVQWQDFQHPTYAQRYPSLGFIRNLSVIDLILNCGPDSRAILLGDDGSERAPPSAGGSGRAAPRSAREVSGEEALRPGRGHAGAGLRRPPR
jgi:hypothetical protein